MDLRGGSRSVASRLSTVHESWHDRLQFTTVYGLLVQVLWELGETTGRDGFTVRGDGLLLGATRVHEEFAAWSTELLAGEGRDELRAAYPVYARHADRAVGRLGEVPGDYLRLHATNALYRSCMQHPGADAPARRHLDSVDLGPTAHGLRVHLVAGALLGSSRPTTAAPAGATQGASDRDERRQDLAQVGRVLVVQVDLILLAVQTERERLGCHRAVDIVLEPRHYLLRHVHSCLGSMFSVV